MNTWILALILPGHVVRSETVSISPRG